MTIAFTFPGQGSQGVGMGKALADAFPEAKAVFDEVDAALGQKLSDVMWNGPEDALTLTANAQPALMAVSLATMRVLEARGFDLAKSVAFVAGHSLGEYSALAAAGSFDVGTAARLLRVRGDAMQNAVPVGQGAMAALLGLDFDVAAEVAQAAAQGEVCQAANDNATTIAPTPQKLVRMHPSLAVGRCPKDSRGGGFGSTAAYHNPIPLPPCLLFTLPRISSIIFSMSFICCLRRSSRL